MNRVLCQALYPGPDPFAMFTRSKTVFHPTQLNKDSILLLHGGADISPSIYNEKANDHCYAQDVPSERDAIEIALVKKARELDIPIIGICRGAQLVCALDGGSLVQHITDHTGGRHTITDVRKNDILLCNSAHHQMLKLNKHNNNILLAISEEPVMGIGEDNVPRKYDFVPEVVYFPKMKAIGIQGHPEWMPKSVFTNWCASLIQEFLLKD